MIAPVTASVTVNRGVEDAFRIFTDGIHTWWPASTHSIGEERTQHVVFETKAGGRIYEVTDGVEAEWGTVQVFEPPKRLVFSWAPKPNPTAFTEVEVRFTAQGEGTRVDLEHRGWERLGDEAEQARESYVPGWKYVLGEFEKSAEL